MTSKHKSFPAKVMLFGEYTVLHGSEAIALPTSGRQLSGHWEVGHETSPGSHMLQQWIQYLRETPRKFTAFNFDAFEEDLSEGLLFSSSIPMGYGMGSSGALCAAALHRYGHDVDRYSVEETREILATMESFFHDSSSGLDPLVSYYNRGFKVCTDGSLSMLDENANQQLNGFYLLDSQKKRKTSEWVNLYMNKCEDATFKSAMLELLKAQNRAITAWENNDREAMSKAISEISLLQWTWMQEWMPESIRPIWKATLHAEHLSVKLCGAGGGGYFLLFDPDKVYNGRGKLISLTSSQI